MQRHFFYWAGWGVLCALTVAVLLPSILTEPRFAQLTWNTLRLVGMVCLLTVPAGSLLAFLCQRTDLPGRRTIAFALGLALFIPLYLQAAAWQAGFGWDGWYTVLAGSQSRPAPGLGSADRLSWAPIATGALVEGWRGAVLVHCAFALPWVVLIVGLGLRQVEGELEETALLDTTPWGVFVNVTLRRALPAIIVAALWVAISTAGEMTVTDLFQVRTYAEEVYTDFTLGTPPGQVAVHALPGVVGAAWGVLAGLLAASYVAPRRAAVSLRARLIFPLGGWRWPLAALVALLVCVVVAVPLASLIYKAGGTATLIDGARVRGWSATKLATLVIEAPSRFGDEMVWSGLLSALTATAAVAAGLSLAWPARRGGWAALPALAVCGLGVALPGPLLGLAIIELLNQPQASWLTTLYDRTLFAPWLALFVRTTPWATLILWSALRSVPQEMLEAAELDGAGAWSRLWRIALPQRLPAIALAWLVSALIALGDLAATILVLPPGVMTLSNRIFERLHYGAEDQVAGLCLLMIASLGGAGLAVRWLARRTNVT